MAGYWRKTVSTCISVRSTLSIYLNILMADINYLEPALVVEYLIFCQHYSHLVILSDNWFALFAQQQGALDLQQIHNLFNVSQ